MIYELKSSLPVGSTGETLRENVSGLQRGAFILENEGITVEVLSQAAKRHTVGTKYVSHSVTIPLSHRDDRCLIVFVKCHRRVWSTK